MKNKIKEKILLAINPKLREKLLLLSVITRPVSTVKKLKKFNRIAKNKKDEYKWGQLNNDWDIWIESLKSITIRTGVGYEIALGFLEDRIEIINNNNEYIDKEQPIVICVVKNDIIKIKEFYKHYRKMGIKNFVILDNNSDDGTFEWLSTQKDTNLFRTDVKYTTNRRQAWINKLISYYGFDRWYIIVDSDELLVYEEMESKTLEDLISFAEKNKYKRIRTITLDMYSEKSFNDDDNNENYLEKYIYFDSDNYNQVFHHAFKCINGGMRVRMFKGTNEKFGPYLTKYPLIYFERGDIQYNSHYSYPFYKNFDGPCWGALLHYKFLKSDMNKYIAIANSGSFYGGSYEYKQYIKMYKENPDMKYIYENSNKYINSTSLEKIKEIERIGW